ncbi:SDR family oxidoreductase/putative virion structural protein [Aeromonas phage ZPAH34]|uniref:SDR family oxidoreductase/putative virion structural protein n=1 Tax=Aeromonas phage ZPAH34 TaxID=2924888 RepID=UPI0023291307|nr:SDR family oxidoreductase/putative virion structural protein [Aeromonas phage ZPAH34]UOX39615.1 SDR family oxidoreductase/putative virion structural protein [Aeromonas phage ZPAH34]
MIGIDFLKKDVPFEVSVAGLEFMERVAPTMFKKLEDFFAPLVKEIDGAVRLVMNKNDYKDLNTIVFAESGVLVNSRSPEPGEPELAIDSGYILPNHLMNSKLVEDYYSAQHSSVAMAMRTFKTDILKGWVDTKTGRIGGDFSKVKFELLVGGSIDRYFFKELHEKYKVPYHSAIAVFICHEIGHVFTHFLTIQSQCFDTVSCYVTSRLAANAKTGIDRYNIIKDFGKETGTETPVKKEDLEGLDETALNVMVTKFINDRNTRRTLSLGVYTRLSETYADIYALKVGCPKTLVVALSSLTDFPIPLGKLFSIGGVATATLFFISPPVGIYVGVHVAALSIIFGLCKLSYTLEINNEYDSPYRRAKNVLRVYAAEINNKKEISVKEKTELLKKAREMEKILDEVKPYFEGTSVQRVMNWLEFGTDFKARDFEHFTQELLSHNLSLYTQYFTEE